MAERERERAMWEAVGRMTAYFGLVEVLMHHLVWVVMGDGCGAVRVSTRRLSFSQVVRLAEEKEAMNPSPIVFTSEPLWAFSSCRTMRSCSRSTSRALASPSRAAVWWREKGNLGRS